MRGDLLHFMYIKELEVSRYYYFNKAPLALLILLYNINTKHIKIHTYFYLYQFFIAFNKLLFIEKIFDIFF